jgi:hypothetical protein
MEGIRDLPGIDRLKDIIKNQNIPVFLAAAGPTLDMIRPFIPQISRRCILIAVDTSLRFILGTGVKPDFVVSLDPQYWNYRHLDCMQRADFATQKSIVLIAESAVYPPCLRYNYRQIFLCGSLFPLGRFIEDRVDPKGEIGAGGSVATSAWDFARIMGAENIWIAGLDLSFPDLKTHFHGALFEDRSHAESYRFKPGETWSVRALRDGKPFKAKNAVGGSVLTDQRLSLYAAWFENRFREFVQIKNYSLGSSGLAINGLEIRSIEELLALPERRDNIISLLENVFKAVGEEYNPKNSSETAKNRAKDYEKGKKDLTNGLFDIKNTSEEAYLLAENSIDRIKKGYTDKKDEENLLYRLDKANRAITTSSVKNVAGFLFPNPDDLEKNLIEDASNKMLRHLEYSKFFYKALMEAAEYHIKYL